MYNTNNHPNGNIFHCSDIGFKAFQVGQTNLHVASIRPCQLVGKLLTPKTILASRLPWLPCSKSRLTHLEQSPVPVAAEPDP